MARKDSSPRGFATPWASSSLAFGAVILAAAFGHSFPLQPLQHQASLAFVAPSARNEPGKGDK